MDIIIGIMIVLVIILFVSVAVTFMKIGVDSFQDGEYGMAIMMGLFGLLILCLIVFGVMFVINDVQKPSLDYGIVTNMEYHEAYSSTTLVPVGKIVMPQTRFHPERWSMTLSQVIRDKTYTEEVTVTQQEYETIEIGDTFKKVYGRWSKTS